MQKSLIEKTVLAALVVVYVSATAGWLCFLLFIATWLK
jgi:hypothetical protein